VRRNQAPRGRLCPRGESVLAVRVQPALAWRPGRVHLSAPGEYEFLIASVSGAVIDRLPHKYELVVHRA
jgi:hypothetical protein